MGSGPIRCRGPTRRTGWRRTGLMRTPPRSGDASPVAPGAALGTLFLAFAAFLDELLLVVAREALVLRELLAMHRGSVFHGGLSRGRGGRGRGGRWRRGGERRAPDRQGTERQRAEEFHGECPVGRLPIAAGKLWNSRHEAPMDAPLRK